MVIAATPSALARSMTPGPAVTLSARVKAATPLSSHTNSTGSLNSTAQFSPSRNGPRLTAPSPNMQVTIASDPCIFSPCAAPTAIGMPPATTPFAPSMPTEKSAMCIEPPLPRQ